MSDDTNPVQQPQPVREVDVPDDWSPSPLEVVGGDVNLDDAAAAARQARTDTENAEGPPCGKCGLPMPPLPSELRALANQYGGVSLSHDVCPTDAPRAAEGRYFELRAEIAEVVEQPDQHGEPIATSITMMEFTVGQRGEDLDSVMRPLALAFGEKWTLAEKQAKVADS